MEKIVEEVLLGKMGAATRFYRELAPKVRRYLIAKLPTEQDAEDILQETFLSAFDSLPLYRGEAKVFSWLLSIAKHEAADFYRKQYVRKAIEKTSPLLEEMVQTAETPEFIMEKKRLRARFLKAYHSLSGQHQDVLSLRFELSMSVKEIAARMNLSQKATESLLFRARRAFANAYVQERD